MATENQKKPPPSPLQRGNVVTEKGREIRELVNWEIRKLVWVVGEKWRGWGEVLRKREAGGLNFGKVCDAKETF